MAFDPTKPVQTRAGHPARIICTDRKGEYPIVALVDDDDKARCFTKDGMYWASSKPCNNDLVNVPQKREGWINIYQDSRRGRYGGQIFSNYKDAKDYCVRDLGPLATVKVEWEE